MRMGVTEPCHAMAFVGYDKEEGGEGRGRTTARWLVENSWGDVNGKGGRLVMGSSWFDDFVVHVAVRRAFLGRKAQRTAERGTTAELLWPWEAGGAAVNGFS